MSVKFTDETKKNEVNFNQNVSTKGGANSTNITIIDNGAFPLIAIIVIAALFWWQNFELPLPDLTTKTIDTQKISSPVLNARGTINGYGKTKLKAIFDAKRNAVIQEVGEYIYAKTHVKEFKIVRDKIISQAKGFVRNVKIVKIKNPEQSSKNLWEVKIRCRVESPLIRKSIEQNPNLSNFMSRRVVVMVPEYIKDNYKKAAHKQLAFKIEESLGPKGFRLFVQKMAMASFGQIVNEFKKQLSKKVYEEIKGIPTDFIIALNVARRELNEQPMVKIDITARDRVGEKFATFTKTYSAKKLDSIGAWEQAIDKCSEEVNQILYKELIHKISKIGKGDKYTFYFCNYNNDQYDKIAEALLNVPEFQRVRIVSRTKPFTRIDLLGPSNIGPLMRNKLRKTGIKWNWQSMGNWIFITKPSCWKLVITIILSVIIFVLIVWHFKRKLSKNKKNAKKGDQS